MKVDENEKVVSDDGVFTVSILICVLIFIKAITHSLGMND